ncbi:hypothetical protein BDA96_01G101800 [Sorghum bicolor]|uniref:CHCH domain-containing protein n=1 Tax=Sorghum bicolor TaxID=4558 RepID=A0A921RXY6_SORBI|nr:hypothetical protein BDA96_01G101800 [Sorghum bicolor]
MSSPPSSVDAARGPETVQVAAPAPMDSADPCHSHSKDFLDCLNSHEIKLGKCMHHLALLHQCRRRADDAMEHSKVQTEGTTAPAALMGNNAGSCYIPYLELKICLNNDEVKLGKCELYLHSLFVCHTRARELCS